MEKVKVRSSVAGATPARNSLAFDFSWKKAYTKVVVR